MPYTGGKQKQISRQCYTCGETGHLAKDCRTSTTESERIRSRCYNCGGTGHYSRDCKSPKSESRGRFTGQANKSGNTRQIQADALSSAQTQSQALSKENPQDFLASSSSDLEDNTGGVRQVRVNDKGSQPRCAKVEVQGVPMFGIVDSGADITIIGAELFKKDAAVAKLRKKDFKKSDKSPHGYDGQPFTLDGRMDLDITFKGKTMCTPVYVKMDAQDQLLLSEGVCRQLNILMYDPDVQVWRGGRRRKQYKRGCPPQKIDSAKVPTVRVRLVQTVRLPPQRSAVVKVQMENGHMLKETLLLEPNSSWKENNGLEIVATAVKPDKRGFAHILITNPQDYTQSIQQGAGLGRASRVDVVSPSEFGRSLSGEENQHIKEPQYNTTNQPKQPQQIPMEGQELVETEMSSQIPVVQQVTAMCTTSSQQRKQKLSKLLAKKDSCLSEEEMYTIESALIDRHKAFALEENERGETDLFQLEIETGDTAPIRQPVRRLPFAVRHEVAQQLKKMQEMGVIQPSNSPWASPIVLVRKKDGSLRFCIDYRKLNTVTKADTFPLTRIDDLLDQLGKSKYLSTLDLAAGYWQIPVHPDSQEKTAFVTHRGLYQFRVMPFGLRNAPAAFQRLMQHVLIDLNPDEDPPFVDMYLDDVLIFSESLEEHIYHLHLVMDCLIDAGLKLNPSKCHFVQKEVQYLGHIITPLGLKLNPERVASVQDFPVPQNVKQARQLVGLASYYRRFIPAFAKIAQPLHDLTRKGAVFEWTPQCQAAFDTLRLKLVEAPLLAYPDFENS